MPPLSPIDAAKAFVIAYGRKNWDEVRASLEPGVIYDEVGTHRKTKGVEEVVAVFQGWAAAMPDSKATFDNALSSGQTAVLEVTWRGTHTGPLQMPNGPIKGTGRPIEVPACIVVQIKDGKAKSIRQYFDMATLLQQMGIDLAA